MTPMHVSDEYQSTIDRAWALFFDPDFQMELRQVMNVSSVDEHEFEDTDQYTKIVYKVKIRRQIPEWARKVLGDVKISFVAHDHFDKTTQILTAKITSDTMPNTIFGGGTWTIRESRPNFVIREFVGGLTVDIPVVGGKMEKLLASAVEADFKAANQALGRRTERDLEALRAGLPLPSVSGPVSLKDNPPADLHH